MCEHKYKKTKMMKSNTPMEMGFYVNEDEIESGEEITIQEVRIFDNQGKLEDYVGNRINKARITYHELQNIWEIQ